MEEFVKIITGIVVLLLGVPLGNYLAKQTKEELKSGQKWFKIIIAIGLLGGLTGLIFKNDAMLFSFFFIAIVTSQSLRKV